jgi:peptidoglycan/xylan/chitin deacetylase (PgdA/CDA1 family)
MNVVMLHSVGNHDSSWHQNWLSVSLEHFEEFCKFLKKENYETLLLEDWYYLQNNPEKIRKNQIVLTFDDGYLDNYVFAYPILKKYNLKGTVFVNPEFIDPSQNIRPTLEAVWNKEIEIKELNPLGFLNWPEIQFLDKSGVLDIQNHSMTHNYYFYSDNLIDFYHGQEEFHWLPWILKKERKPFWLIENQSSYVPYGYPLFEYGRALGLKRFIPSEGFIKEFIMEVKRIESSPKNQKLEILKRFIEDFKLKNGEIGVFESDLETQQRFEFELLESKRILEEKLNKKVDFLCWPGGGYNELSLKSAKEAGYLASTIASREKHKTLDNSHHYKRIQRFGLGSFERIGNKKIYNPNRKTLVHNYQKMTGGLGKKIIIKLLKLKDRILL